MEKKELVRVKMIAWLILIIDIIIFWGSAFFLPGNRSVTIFFSKVPLWGKNFFLALGAALFILDYPFIFFGDLWFHFSLFFIIVPLVIAIGLLKLKNIARIFFIIICGLNIIDFFWNFMSVLFNVDKVYRTNFLFVWTGQHFLILLTSVTYIIYFTRPKVREYFK